MPEPARDRELGEGRRLVTGRNELARQAHLRSGAGPIGGTEKQKIRRRRKRDHVEERNAARGVGTDEE
jgi:hypothetical protein